MEICDLLKGQMEFLNLVRPHNDKMFWGGVGEVKQHVQLLSVALN